MALGYQINPLGRKPQKNAIDEMLLRVVRGRETADPLEAAIDDPLQAALVETRTFPLPDAPRLQATPLEDPTPAIEDTETPSITDIMRGRGEQQATIADIPDSTEFSGIFKSIDEWLNKQKDSPEKDKTTFDRLGRAETGGKSNPNIRTEVMPQAGSSAFGTHQITRGLLRDSLDKIDYTPREREFANHMIAQQDLGLRFGHNPNAKSAPKTVLLRRYLDTVPGATPESFESLQYGGNLGIFRNEEDEATYQSIAKKLFNQQITQFDNAKKPYSDGVFTRIAKKFKLTVQDVKAALVWHQGLNKAVASDGWKWLESKDGEAYLKRMSKA